MTDRERIEITYTKVKRKYPHVTDKEEIDTLAIKLEQKNLFLKSIAWLAGAVACFIIFLLINAYTSLEETRYIFLVMTGSGIFEFVRTLIKLSKVKQQFKPMLQVKNEGQLTKSIILRDGHKVLKKSNYIFRIVKTPLYDKNDELEVGLDNFTYHDYQLLFKLQENDFPISYKVSKAVYMNSVLNCEYYLVLTIDNKIAAVYQASNWILAKELESFYSAPIVKETPVVQDAPVVAPNNTDAGIYQPVVSVQKTTPVKTKKLLPILGIVFCGLSFLLPILFALPLVIAALVLSIVAIVTQRSKLSIASLIVSIVFIVLLFLAIVAAFAGYI